METEPCQIQLTRVALEKLKKINRKEIKVRNVSKNWKGKKLKGKTSKYKTAWTYKIYTEQQDPATLHTPPEQPGCSHACALA